MADNEIEIIVEVDDRASAKLDQIAESAEKIGDSMDAVMRNFMDIVTDATDHAKEKFKNLRIGDGKESDFAGGMRGSLKALTTAFLGVGGAAATAGTQMAGAAASGSMMAASGTVASGGLNLVATAAIGAAAAAAAAMSAMFALAPALAAVGGLMGGAITGMFGAGIAAGTLGIGLGGVTDAWNAYGKSAGGGGGASKAGGEAAYQAARRIEQAEDALTRAKRTAMKASQDVSKAREDERERIEDLTLALRAQKFAQEDATEELARAEEKLAREKAFGNSTSQDAAQKEVDRAKYRYDYETERLDDLKKEKADADRKGIEGSEQVQSALERERDAAESVKDAMEALADAKRKTATASGGAAGGINAFNDAMSKLAPNAQKFVRKLIELKERFADVKREIQNRLFAGLDQTLEKIADVWGPKLIPIFGGMADALNRMAKAIGAGLADPRFRDNIEKIGKSFEVFLGYLGDAVVDLLDAFGRIGAAASPVLEKIGWIIADIAESFAEWIEQAEKTGDLDSFMKTAAYYIQQIYDIGKLAFGILGEIVEILFPSSDKAGTSFLAGVEKSLERVKEWLGDPKNQQRIRDMFDKFEDFFDKLVNEWIPDLKQFGRDFGNIVRPIMNVVSWLSRVHNFLTVRIPNGIKDLSRRGGNIFDGVRNGFRAGVNWIISKWNSLQFTMPSVTIFGTTLGGGTFGTDNIDYLATGGITGAGRAIMNERGPEAVRLPQGSMVYSAGDSARMMGGQGRDVNVRVKVDRPTERGMIDLVMSMIRFEVESAYGGDVQRALGADR